MTTCQLQLPLGTDREKSAERCYQFYWIGFNFVTGALYIAINKILSDSSLWRSLSDITKLHDANR